MHGPIAQPHLASSSTPATAPAGKTGAPTNRAAIIGFFALTYALSWSVWASTLAQSRGWIGWSLAEPFAFLAVTVAAVTATWASGGRRGLAELGGRWLRWRVHPKWYVAALVLPGLPALGAIGVHLALGGTHDFGALVPFTGALPLLATQLLLHLITEEVGWRGVALPRLRIRFGPLQASLILGMLWAVWHTPLFLLPDSRQTYSYIGFALMVVAISVIMTWLFDRTRQSVLLAAIFHAAMNTWFAVTNTLWGDTLVFWLCVALTVAMAAYFALIQVKAKEDGALK